MALQVWLPLNKNGDLNNKGLANVTVTNNGATYNDSGKIGGCYSFNGSSNYISTNQDIYFSPNNKVSISFWIYPTTDTGSVFGTSSWLWQLRLESNKVFFNQWNSNGSDSLTGTSINNVNVNSWNHICYTWSGVNMTLYINGSIDTTFTYVNGNTYKTGSLLNIGGNIYSSNRSGSSYFSGKLNDVRIYDHCLSQKEVKELSKGLVLHYPLNDWQILRSRCSNITWNLLFRSIQGYQTSSFTQNNGVYTSISTTSSDLTGFVLSATLIPLHKYLITFDIKKNYETGSCICRAWCSSKSFGDYLVQNISPILTEWTPTYVLYNASNLTVTNNDGSYYFWFRRADYQNCNGTETVWTRNINVFDLTLMFGSGNEPTYLEFNLMFPLQLKYERDEGTIKNLVLPIPDSSGYDNNGTITGTLTTSTDTPRYDKCTVFNGSSNKILTGFNYSNYGNDFTISAWVKSNVNNGGYLTAIGNELSNGGIVFGELGSTNTFRCYLNGTNGADINRCAYNSFTENTWYHAVYTVKDALSAPKAKLYINGELVSSSNETVPFGEPENAMFIGANGNYRWWNGFISDFRIYTTTLSENDIKELYNTAAFVDNHGNVECFQAYEDSDSQVMKTGQVKTGEFVENYDYLYLPAGVYVNTGLQYNSNTCKAETTLRYASGGSGRDLMGFSGTGAGYWGVTANGAWESHGTFSYTNSDITVLNKISYEFTGETGTYLVGALIGSYSPRAKYIYRVKLYKNGVLERDLYPCKGSDKNGLVDVLTGTFYPATANTATLGNDSETRITKVYDKYIECNQLIEI